ncbi:type II toxin-antitoxin system BrnA family antitoxin [Bifidobacterium sp.]|uniref:type II toxin-antitoxin system BrnA family antitoxin n=1 Tax=Bifidobacterium sp. TaxID=41200 RepID=UPI0025C24C0A|nr:ribbon-helix-helix protein, CopG family [Bifidobacterium sp.]MCH4209399.1 ribbon-helix-helix protein, CopG family [Bifidobacterium sp.]
MVRAWEVAVELEYGQSILDYADMSALRKPNKEEQRPLSVQLPEWLIDVLDREARRMGISRRDAMKVWLAERADAERFA